MKTVRVRRHQAHRRVSEVEKVHVYPPEVRPMETLTFSEFERQYGTSAYKLGKIKALREYLTDFMPYNLGVRPLDVVVYGSFLTSDNPGDLDVVVHSHEPVGVIDFVEDNYWSFDRGIDVVHRADHDSYYNYLLFAQIETKNRPHPTGRLLRLTEW